MEDDDGAIVVYVRLSLVVMEIHAIEEQQGEREDHGERGESSKTARHASVRSNGCA